MGQGAFLYNDLTAAGTITGSTTPSDLPWSRLQDPQPRHRARIASTSGYLIIDLGSVQSLDRFALISTNLTSAATRQLRASATDATVTSALELDTNVGAANTDTKWNGNVHHPRLAAPISARYVRWDLADASLSSIDIGLAPCGLMWQPTVNYAIGDTRGRSDLGTREVNAITGTHHARSGPKPRVRTFIFEALDDDEVDDYLEDMDRLNGIDGDVLFDPDTGMTAAELAQHAIWGAWKSPETLSVNAAPTDPPMISRPFRLLERL